jgi:hypothetical protein
MNLRSGVPAFDRLWDGTVPSDSRNSQNVTCRRIENTPSYWQTNADYSSLPKPVQNAVDGILSRGDTHVWVYSAYHYTPRSDNLIVHGHIVTDQFRFPFFTVEPEVAAITRSLSRKVMFAVKVAIDSIAWAEFEALLTEQVNRMFLWDVLMEDCRDNVNYDRYENPTELRGTSFVCSFPALRDMAGSEFDTLWQRADEYDEEFQTWLDEALQGAFEEAASLHGLWMSVEDNDCHVGMTVLEIYDTAELAHPLDYELEAELSEPLDFEWQEYPAGYGHPMAQPAEQRIHTFPIGTPVIIQSIRGLDNIKIELESDKTGTVTEVVSLEDLKNITHPLAATEE